MSSVSQEKGSAWEEKVKEHHEEALRLGIVSGPVEHNEPHWRKIHGIWERVAAGVADFTGVLYNGHGTSLAVECKSYEHRLTKSAITTKQQQHLDSVVRGGGLAFLLAEITDGVKVEQFAVPWQLTPWKIARTKEGVVAADLQQWKIPVSCKCYLDKYCPVRGTPVATAKRVFPRE